MYIGNKIKYLMELKGMTQLELAEKAGVSDRLIKSLINDADYNPTIETLRKVANALGVELEYFFSQKRVTPFELLKNHLPDDIKEFILKQDSIDYLELAKDLAETELSPRLIRTIINNYREIMRIKEEEK